MKVSVVEQYRCSKAHYLDHYFNPESRHSRVVGMGGVSFTAQEVSRTETEWRMRAELVERSSMPAPIRSVFGATNRLEEDSVWVVGSDVIQVEIRPAKMRDKVTIRGNYRMNEKDDGTCEVTLELEVVAKIFGIGGMVEKMAAKEMPVSIAKDAAFFNKHIADA